MNPECLGCMRSFEQGFRLPLEDLTIQLKNYNFPIRDQQHRFILLKTIVSFLNSKGGTIYVGAEDKTGEVLGIAIQRKQRDDFKLFVQQLVDKIQPKVDLSNRQEVMMQFVPVNKNGVFTDRYIGKIIVKQGDTSKLYCISQKVVLTSSANDKKYDQFQVLYSFKRMNMGSVKKITGYDVVLQATSRALKPPQQINIFHPGCNPEPVLMSSQPSIPSQQGLASPKQKAQSPPSRPKSSPKIPKYNEQNEQDFTLQFFKIKDLAARQKLQAKIQEIIGILGIKWYIISYEEENDTIVVQFVVKKEWQKAMDYVDANLDKINQALDGKASFMKKQCEDDFAVYQNQKPFNNDSCISGEMCQILDYVTKAGQSAKQEQKQQDEISKQSSIQRQVRENQQKKEKTEEKQQLQPQDQIIIQETPQQIKKSQSIEQQAQTAQNKDKSGRQKNFQKAQKNSQQYQIKLTSQRKQKQNLYSSTKFVSLPSNVKIDIGQSSVLTITHLNPATKNELKKFVNELNASQKKIDEYDKTLEFHFASQADFQDTYDKLIRSKDLTKFGFRGRLIFGINTGQIIMENYDRNKYSEFKEYIQKLVDKDMKRCEFTKKGDKYSLVLTLKQSQKAAKWLDKLVLDKDIKQFRIPNNQAMKMRIDLVCVKPTKDKNKQK